MLSGFLLSLLGAIALGLPLIWASERLGLGVAGIYGVMLIAIIAGVLLSHRLMPQEPPNRPHSP